MHLISRILLSAALSSVALSATAQTNGSNSPYSRYGYGLLGDGANAFNKGMAGTAYGMRGGREINTKNPASYSAIDSLSFLFDFGLSLQHANLKQNGSSVNAKNTSVDYINAAFRVAPGLGMSIGMMPYSTIGYSTNTSHTTSDATGDVTETSNYSGDGGLHEVYVGAGWAPIKQLSVGVNAGYLWGTLSHTAMQSFSSSAIAGIRQAYEADVRTYKLGFGVQYDQLLTKHDRLTLGLTYGLGHDIASKGSYYKQRVESSSVTSGDTTTLSNAFALPHTFGAGLTWTHNNRFRVGVDYTLEKWADVRFPALGSAGYDVQTGLFDDRHKVSVGFEYMGKEDGIRRRDFIRYRAGFSYATPYAKVDGKEGPRSYTASLGVALPIMNMHNNRSYLNISAQYERVEPKVAGMLKENYLRLCVGIAFNERWFMKWKAE